MTDVVDQNGDIQGSSDLLSSIHQVNSIHGIKIISGGYYAATGLGCQFSVATASASPLPTGKLYFYPFFPPASSFFSSIAMRTGTGVPGSNINMGVYNNDYTTGLPTGSPIPGTMSGSISAASSSTNLVFNFSSPIYLLNSNIYWLAASTDNSSTSLTFLSGFSVAFDEGGINTNCIGIGEPGTKATVYNGYTQSFVYNATLPSVGTLSANSVSGVGQAALIFLKAQ